MSDQNETRRLSTEDIAILAAAVAMNGPRNDDPSWDARVALSCIEIRNIANNPRNPITKALLDASYATRPGVKPFQATIASIEVEERTGRAVVAFWVDPPRDGSPRKGKQVAHPLHPEAGVIEGIEYARTEIAKDNPVVRALANSIHQKVGYVASVAIEAEPMANDPSRKVRMLRTFDPKPFMTNSALAQQTINHFRQATGHPPIAFPEPTKP